MSAYSLISPSFVCRAADTAAYKLTEAQHAPGVTQRLNPQTFRVEYIRPDGSVIPPYSHFLQLAQEGKI